MKNQIERAEPSRGAPERAAKFYLKWANDSYGVYPDRKLPSEHLLHFAASFAASECVVLLEALRSTMQSLDDWLCDDTISDETQSEMLTLEDELLKILRKFEAEAAIQQAERT